MYALTEIMSRRKSKYMAVGSELIKIPAIMICHKFDNSSLFLTLPVIYESGNKE